MRLSPNPWIALAPLVLGACLGQDTSTSSVPGAQTEFLFGPYALAPGQELTDQCVSQTLGNEEAVYLNSVELTTGAGFHHTNWFWVPDYMFPGDDGTWSCKGRGYSEAVAGIKGGVVFAQSTQSPHEIQQFPAGVAVKIPPHSKLVAGTHLLNALDTPLEVSLSFTLGPIEEASVSTILAGMAFENESIALPPHAKSRFNIECDLGPRHQAVFGRLPDFKIYYMLPHYHSLGTGMTIEAVRDDNGAADMVFTTAKRIGDALGGPISPLFDMTGHSKIRFSCSYDNPRDTTVRWGVGDQEMCVFLAFSDSTYTWGGGAPSVDDAGPSTDNGGTLDFQHGCQVFVSDATH